MIDIPSFKPILDCQVVALDQPFIGWQPLPEKPPRPVRPAPGIYPCFVGGYHIHQWKGFDGEERESLEILFHSDEHTFDLRLSPRHLIGRRLYNFCRQCGVKGDGTLREALDRTRGRRVLVKYRPGTVLAILPALEPRDGKWPARWNGSHPLPHAELTTLLSAVAEEIAERPKGKTTSWLLAAYRAELNRVRSDPRITFEPTVAPTAPAVLVPGSMPEVT
jgi:hypothetical protein